MWLRFRGIIVTVYGGSGYGLQGLVVTGYEISFYRLRCKWLPITGIVVMVNGVSGYVLRG